MRCAMCDQELLERHLYCGVCDEGPLCSTECLIAHHRATTRKRHEGAPVSADGWGC